MINFFIFRHLHYFVLGSLHEVALYGLHLFTVPLYPGAAMRSWRPPPSYRAVHGGWAGLSSCASAPRLDAVRVTSTLTLSHRGPSTTNGVPVGSLITRCHGRVMTPWAWAPPYFSHASMRLGVCPWDGLGSFLAPRLVWTSSLIAG